MSFNAIRADLVFLRARALRKPGFADKCCWPHVPKPGRQAAGPGRNEHTAPIRSAISIQSLIHKAGNDHPLRSLSWASPELIMTTYVGPDGRAWHRLPSKGMGIALTILAVTMIGLVIVGHENVRVILSCLGL
jgi:hypothetical protein